MVDVERVHERLGLLERLVERLELIASRGLQAYLADEDQRLVAERQLQLALQICIDLGAQVVSELSVPTPSDNAGVFRRLADGGVLEPDLAGRMAVGARQRNLLVHAYLELDDRLVFASLSRLDDLRAFAAAIARFGSEG